MDRELGGDRLAVAEAPDAVLVDGGEPEPAEQLRELAQRRRAVVLGAMM